MSKAGRLWLVLLLNLVLVAGLVIAGLAADSLGVLAAGVDYLADAAAIGCVTTCDSACPPSGSGARHAE